MIGKNTSFNPRLLKRETLEVIARCVEVDITGLSNKDALSVVMRETDLMIVELSSWLREEACSKLSFFNSLSVHEIECCKQNILQIAKLLRVGDSRDLELLEKDILDCDKVVIVETDIAHALQKIDEEY